MAKSMKTFAHALTLAQSDRVLSVRGKSEYSLTLKVEPTGKTFTLKCGSTVNVVKSSEHGGADSVRDIADQLCERLAAASGAAAPEMSISETAARPRVTLNLEAAPKARK